MPAGAHAAGDALADADGTGPGWYVVPAFLFVSLVVLATGDGVGDAAGLLGSAHGLP